MPVEFRLLGPVQIWSGGDQVALKRRQERLILAVLLLEPGKQVPVQRLVDLLWPDAMPTNPRRALQVYISRLRTLLDVELVSSRAGYSIQAPPGSTDLEHYRSLVAQARHQDDLDRRSKLLTEALDLWRGPALADVATEDIRQRLCSGIEEERWAGEELLLTTELARGHHQELLPRLADLTAAQPTRETFATASMLALYRSGRQTDALSVYSDLVRRLDEDLGLEPGAEARDLQVAILRQDPVLDFTVPPTVPRELPADVGVLIGRDDVLDELSGILTSTARPGVPTVVCLYGAAGTGKSAAAVRLGHRLADAFPDGQLFARLQDVNGQARPPTSILGQLLRSLGVEGSELPDSLEERSALLRSRLADSATLLVFDDALDAGQLRPLLPAHGAVIVTSRRPLLGLEDATHQELHPLSDETSAELLGTISGLGATAIADVVPYCAGLPLALRIVGARLALIREPVSEVVRTLADESQRLDYLIAGDRAVRASLDLTLSTTTPEARRLFALLALVGADDFAPWVAAALLNTDEPTAAAVLENLAVLGLVQLRRHTPHRYGLHGLVRARTVELLAEESDRSEVEQRYLETVLRLVTIADENVDHGGAVLTPDSVEGGLDLPAAATEAGAGASWLDDALPVVRAAVELAAETHPRLAGLLAYRLSGYLAVRDHREHREAVISLGRDGAVRAEDVVLEAELDRAAFSAAVQSSSLSQDHLASLARRAVDSAERSGSAELLIFALGQSAYRAILRMDVHEVSRITERILAIADTAEITDVSRARAHDWAAAALQYREQIAAAVEQRRLACTYSAPGTRVHAIRLVLLGETAILDTDLGAARVEELSAAVAEARSIIDRIGDELGSAHVDNLDAIVSILRGDLAAAELLLDRAAEIFDRRPDEAGQGLNGVGRARLALAAGRPAQARELLSAALRAIQNTGFARLEPQMHARLLGLAPDPADT